MAELNIGGIADKMNSTLEPMTKRLRLDNFTFKEQVSATSVLFVEKQDAEEAEAYRQASKGNVDLNALTGDEKKTFKRANELLISWNHIPAPLDEETATMLLRRAGFKDEESLDLEEEEEEEEDDLDNIDMEGMDEPGDERGSGSDGIGAKDDDPMGSVKSDERVNSERNNSLELSSVGSSYTDESVRSKKIRKSRPKKSFENDRYCKYLFPSFLDGDLEITYPAARKDVEKKKAIPLLRVEETFELYEMITYPKFIELAHKWDKWVLEIIEGRAEQDDIIYSDSDFLIVKDYKWNDPTNLDQIHYLAIFKDTNIRSLRNLDATRHLKPLQRILKEGPTMIHERFFDQRLRRIREHEVMKNSADMQMVADPFGAGRDRGKEGPRRVLTKQEKEELKQQKALEKKLEADLKPPPQLICFVHYHPTFWYFHVHIMSTKHVMFTNELGGEGLLLTAMDRFHKLENIIEMLKISPEYYKHATLTTVLREHNAKFYSAEYRAEQERKAKSGLELKQERRDKKEGKKAKKSVVAEESIV